MRVNDLKIGDTIKYRTATIPDGWFGVYVPSKITTGTVCYIPKNKRYVVVEVACGSNRKYREAIHCQSLWCM